MARPEITIVGGGIAGLALALNLHARGIKSRIFESAPELRELGVGITLLPHAMREIALLGLDSEVAAAGIVNEKSEFFNRFGQLLYSEKRGKFVGYEYPEISLNRGRLHGILYRAVLARLGPETIVTAHKCVGVEQDASSVKLLFDVAGARIEIAADYVVACDGVNSAIRAQFYPGEQVVFSGVNTWRGVTRFPAARGGRTYMRIGSFKSGNIIVYPIADCGDGEQMINWVAQIPADQAARNDWNKVARLEDFAGFFATWKYDWLDIPAMLAQAPTVLEYPMVDKDPIPKWTFGRVTLAGDAAHPMYPRGSNGSAQALIDVRELAQALSEEPEATVAFDRYEQSRRPATAHVVETNRRAPPDYINIRVEELTGDRPFENLDDYISQDELRALSDAYKTAAGFSLSGSGGEK